MAAYVIADIEIQDAAAFRDYQQRAAETVARHGGRYVVRGGKAENLEGNWQTTRLIMLEFPSLDAATTWYNSAEYQALAPIRHRTTRTAFVSIVDGGNV